MTATIWRSRRVRGPVTLAAAFATAFLGCTLLVYEPRPRSLAVTPANATVAVVTTQQLAATVTYEDTSTRDVTAEATWTSSRPDVASVDGGGLVTPHLAGTTTITASLRGVSGSTPLTVTSAQLSSLEVTPANASIANGTRLQLAAIGHFDDGSAQDLTSQVTWTSSDSSVTIGGAPGSAGLASSTALGAATSTITAAFGAISGSTTLTVNAVSLTSMAVSPATATIVVGTTRQFAATGTFSDASTQVMTGEVTWGSSDASVATVAPTGLATGLLAGSATITATSSALLGSSSGSAQLTVQASSPGY
ncbi:MAG TPA: Ig-like domain-containing protein [Anaeromyxobacteraceae bacterium]|nr:Ig-like domain-containing protein [Anaeromyxobacteraceae bacterium]